MMITEREVKWLLIHLLSLCCEAIKSISHIACCVSAVQIMIKIIMLAIFFFLWKNWFKWG